MMSATGEVENAVVEQSKEEAPAAEQPQPLDKATAAEEPQPAEEPVKEKKPRAPREKKPRAPREKTAPHPPYFQMIKEALLALNEKSGSSPYAIAKYMEEKHKAVLPANFRKMLGLQLKNSAAKGKLIKIKASYKLSEAGNKEKGATKTKAKAAKAVTEKKEKEGQRKRKAATEKKGGAKVGRKKAKKSAPAKPKQPKSIKSPAAKKAKKARV
ncbi:hypothetical protein NMG60_11007884 [Bertholletia excelsa]